MLDEVFYVDLDRLSYWYSDLYNCSVQNSKYATVYWILTELKANWVMEWKEKEKLTFSPSLVYFHVDDKVSGGKLLILVAPKLWIQYLPSSKYQSFIPSWWEG